MIVSYYIGTRCSVIFCSISLYLLHFILFAANECGVVLVNIIYSCVGFCVRPCFACFPVFRYIFLLACDRCLPFIPASCYSYWVFFLPNRKHPSSRWVPVLPCNIFRLYSIVARTVVVQYSSIIVPWVILRRLRVVLIMLLLSYGSININTINTTISMSCSSCACACAFVSIKILRTVPSYYTLVWYGMVWYHRYTSSHAVRHYWRFVKKALRAFCFRFFAVASGVVTFWRKKG